MPSRSRVLAAGDSSAEPRLQRVLAVAARACTTEAGGQLVGSHLAVRLRLHCVAIKRTAAFAAALGPTGLFQVSLLLIGWGFAAPASVFYIKLFRSSTIFS